MKEIQILALLLLILQVTHSASSKDQYYPKCEKSSTGCQKYSFYVDITNLNTQNKLKGTIHIMDAYYRRDYNLILFIFKDNNIPTKTKYISTIFPFNNGNPRAIDSNVPIKVNYGWEEYKYKGIQGQIHDFQIETGTFTFPMAQNGKSFKKILTGHPEGWKIKIGNEGHSYRIDGYREIKYSALNLTMNIIMMIFSCFGSMISIGISVAAVGHNKPLVFGMVYPYVVLSVVWLRYLIQYNRLGYMWVAWVLLTINAVILVPIGSKQSTVKLLVQKHNKLVFSLGAFNMIAFIFLMIYPSINLLPYSYTLIISGIIVDAVMIKQESFYQSLYIGFAYILPISFFTYMEFYQSPIKLQEIPKERFFQYLGVMGGWIFCLVAVGWAKAAYIIKGIDK